MKIRTHVIKSYENDGITDNSDIFGYDYGFENESPIKIKVYNSYRLDYKFNDNY